jgi:hypothetical protein
MMTFRPTTDTSANPRENNHKARDRKQTFWSKRNTDSVCKHINAFEDARAALVGKLNFLVSATGENGAGSLRRSTTERARRAGGDVMHGVGMCRGGREEREERWMVRRKWVGRKGRKEIRGKAAQDLCLSICLVRGYVSIKEISHASILRP